MTKFLAGISGKSYKIEDQDGEKVRKYVGVARAGKDTFTGILPVSLHMQPFALPLKQASQVLFGLTDDQMWNDAVKDTPVSPWELSPRVMWQRLGTEGGRSIDQNLWVNLAMSVWEDLKEGKHKTPEHTDASSISGPNPTKEKDFDDLLGFAAKTMFLLKDKDIHTSQSLGWPLPGQAFSFEEAKVLIKEKVIPAVLNMPHETAWEFFLEKRQELPSISKVTHGAYKVPDHYDGMMVTDVRFENEASALIDHGASMIIIERDLPDNIKVAPAHASEQGLRIRPEFIMIQNDGTMEDLKVKARSVADMLLKLNQPEQSPSAP